MKITIDYDNRLFAGVVKPPARALPISSLRGAQHAFLCPCGTFTAC